MEDYETLILRRIASGESINIYTVRHKNNQWTDVFANNILDCVNQLDRKLLYKDQFNEIFRIDRTRDNLTQLDVVKYFERNT